MSKPQEIVADFFRAIAERDFEQVRLCLSDGGFVSRSPVSTFDNADAFINDIARVGPILEGVQTRKMFVDGNDVCAIVDYITRMDQRQVTPVVHLMRVEGDKIASVETFFDARAYAEM